MENRYEMACYSDLDINILKTTTLTEEEKEIIAALKATQKDRAYSIVVSGSVIYRPKGVIKPADVEKPVFSPTRQLDFELETAFVIGKETHLGESISTAHAEDYIFVR